MSFIQLPYGLVENDETVKLPLNKNYATGELFKRLPHIDNINDPKQQNEAIKLIENRSDFRKYLLATSDFSQSFQDNIDNLVTDGAYNNAGLRRALDGTNSGIFKTANPLSLIFKHANKFDLQNPVLGNLLAQIQAGQLTDKEVQRLLSEGENKKIETWLNALIKSNELQGGGGDDDDNDDNDDDDDDDGRFGGAGSKKPWRQKGPIGRKYPLPKDGSSWKHVDQQQPPSPPPPPSPQYPFRGKKYPPRPPKTLSAQTGPSVDIPSKYPFRPKKTLSVETGPSVDIPGRTTASK